MKIILLCSIFPPEPFLAAQTAFSMAKKLTAIGHQVMVITSYPNRPGGKIYEGYHNRLFSRGKSQYGFEVVRCYTTPSSKSSFLSRFTENIVFGASSSLFLMFIPKIDLIFSDTWPVFATGLISLVARIRRIHYIVWVNDLYPESLLSQKRLRQNFWVTDLMRKIDSWIARGAVHLAVLTKSFARVYQEDRKIPSEKITVIPSWIEGDLDLVDINQVMEIRQQFEIKDSDFLVVYGGNIGVGAGVDTLIKASELVDDIHVLIAGGGSELLACRELASSMNSTKISFYNPWPEEKTMALYQAADVLVLPTHGEQSIASIPSKLIRYMLSGRPIIAAGLQGTELCNLVEESGCGWVIPPDDPKAIAYMIDNARSIGQLERGRLGMAGREYALKNLTADVILPKLIKILESTIS
jgi:colanic acid biosynthesis glycosyl transferase WcaI